ncbi:hypothetical protein ACHAPU_000677 [Fusarium lateritium]
MKALVLNTSLRAAMVEDLDRPIPSVGEILIHVGAIALNPVDELYVTSPIAACSVNDRPGAFAEYITIPYELVWAVPEGISLEEASTISMFGLTAAQAIYSRLGLPSPFSANPSTQSERESESTNIFIYGSSTSVGLYAAQLARIAENTSGKLVRLVGAANSSKHEMLRNEPYRYDVLVDYRDADWVTKVKAATNGKGIDLALDCISENMTVYNTHDTLTPSAKFAVIRGPVGGQYDPATLNVKPTYGAVWEGLGVEVGYNGAVLLANPDAYAFAKEFYSFLSKPSPPGRAQLEPNPVRRLPGGLEKVIPDGFSLLGSGSVSERVKLARDEDYMLFELDNVQEKPGKISAVTNPSLAELVEDGNVYDFTLTCDGEEFRLHRAIVCPKSFAIKKILEERSEETQPQVICVENFDSDTVDNMLEFMYLGRYTLKFLRDQHEVSADELGDLLDTSRDEMTVRSLLAHLRTYSIANHFEVAGLHGYSRSQIKHVFANSPARLVPRLLQEMTSSTAHEKLPCMVASDVAFNMAGRIEDVVAALGFHRVDEDSSLLLKVVDALEEELEFSRRIQDIAMSMANSSIEDVNSEGLEVTSRCQH